MARSRIELLGSSEASRKFAVNRVRNLKCELIVIGTGKRSDDRFPDDMPVGSLCRRMVCTRCGYIGADVRPDWSLHDNKRHV